MKKDQKPVFSNKKNTNKEIRYHLTSLGCPKNLVESEEMMAKMSLSGMVMVHDPEEADVLVINTCGFIDPAKKETIDVILEMAEVKERRPGQKLVVAGCMVQRYRKEMTDDLPEVDAFVGVEDRNRFLDVVWEVLGKKPANPVFDSYPFAPRLLTTPPHLAYLRIADGCSHCCSYCTIPLIRGKHVSRPMEEIVKEAESLVGGGVKELVIIAQDTTSYGIDLYGHAALSDLLLRLDGIEGLEWMRLMYTYPNMIDKRLADVFAQSSKLVSYIDMPIQHGDSEMLKQMNRGISNEPIRQAVKLLRSVRKEMVFRTTVMVGFPGEQSEHFETMWSFLKDLRFDRVGVFAYSCEEGTPAADFVDQVAEQIKEERHQSLFEWSLEEARQKNQKFVGQILPVLIDCKNPEGAGYIGRFYGQAPEVDGQVFVKGKRLKIGEFVTVRIDEADEENLSGVVHIDVTKEKCRST